MAMRCNRKIFDKQHFDETLGHSETVLKCLLFIVEKVQNKSLKYRWILKVMLQFIPFFNLYILGFGSGEGVVFSGGFVVKFTACALGCV